VLRPAPDSSCSICPSLIARSSVVCCASTRLKAGVRHERMNVLCKCWQLVWSFLTASFRQHDARAREEVVARLARRVALSDPQWKAEFYPDADIPENFISWFRQSISKWWELDLSRAVPSDRLTDELGLGVATWNDTYQDVVEDLMDSYGVTMPESRELLYDPIATLDDMLRLFWKHASRSMNEESSNQALHGTTDSRADASASVP